MLKTEQNYDFRRRLDTLHAPGRRDPLATAAPDEFSLPDGLPICFPADAPSAVIGTAKDLSDYFRVSMGLRTILTPDGAQGLLLDCKQGLGPFGTYRIDTAPGRIALTGADASGIRRAGVHLEDLLNRRGGPFLKTSTELHTPLISPRIVHSGWGIELFPDAHLNAIIHAGFDAIAVFCTGLNRTNVGSLDFNDLARRAADFGIKTFLYSYLPAYKHPDDPDAEAFFDGVYGELLRHCPDIDGIMLVGESAQFPSHDPATTGKRWNESITDGIPDVRPSPGWWPCKDYPDWLRRVRDAIWKVRPGLTILFNTYNWGWAPLEQRREFLSRLPEGITVQVTYDIFSQRRLGGLTVPTMDYSITAADPGYYFSSECETAAEFGIPLLSTANTAGTTWDFGDVPYIPVPQRWARRFRQLDHFRQTCRLSAFYDCHHYGWWPSPVTALGRAYFTSPQCDLDAEIAAIADEMAGAGAGALLEAWQAWSDAFDYLPATNEDQYGPLRVGPSYPLIFQPNLTRTMASKEIAFPCDPNAHFGNAIIFTFYQPYENDSQPPASLRYPVELRALEEFDRIWAKGQQAYRLAIAAAPDNRREALEREYNLGDFIRHAARTCYHVKKWWTLNHRLQAAADTTEGLALLDEITALLELEADNARETIPIVDADSRLGWEPSMEYVCDRWHLEWKLRQLESARREIDTYRGCLALAANDGF